MNRLEKLVQQRQRQERLTLVRGLESLNTFCAAAARAFRGTAKQTYLLRAVLQRMREAGEQA